MPRKRDAAAAQDPRIDTARRRAIRRRLLSWYGDNARDLPWRRTRDPYRVWVSEVMLQQTRVDAVVPYYTRFLAEFPTVADLAAAEEERVLRLWEGLGYYRRARSLHAAAKKVVAEHGGEMPRDLDGLLGLPGVGRYTAGAIASIAYDTPAPIVEANTIRLLTRLTAYSGDPTGGAGQRFLWGAAEELLPRREAGRFNQAMMEVGALVCAPRDPACDACPLAPCCEAHRTGAVDRLAATTKKLDFTDAREAAVVVRNNQKVLVRRCGEGERWAGLWDFPRFPIESEGPLFARDELAAKVLDQTGVRCEPGALFATLKHGVTRFRITLECYEANRVGGRLRPPANWLRPQELKELPLSVTGRKIARRLTRD